MPESIDNLLNGAGVTAILGAVGALGAWFYKLWRTSREDRCTDQAAVISHYKDFTAELNNRIKTLVEQLTAAADRCDRETTDLSSRLVQCQVRYETALGELRMRDAIIGQLRGGVPFTPEDSAVTAISMDQDGTILEAHPIITHLSHYFARELVGQNVKVLIPARYHAAHEAGMARVIKDDVLTIEGKQLPVHLRRKEGDEIPVSLLISGWKSKGRWYFSGLLQRRPDDQAADPFAPKLPDPAPEAHP